jgi:peptidoglycan/LPS O-acetylase OafA/YrhL
MVDSGNARMKTILRIGYFLLVIIYLITKNQDINRHFPDVLRFYLADLFCLPIVLGATLFLMRQLLRNPNFQLSKAMIAVAFIAFSILFEVALPLSSNTYTADLWDVAAYGTGGLGFFFCQKWVWGGMQNCGSRK